MESKTIFTIISIIAILGIIGSTINTGILLQEVDAATCQQFYDSNDFVTQHCSKSHSPNSAFNFGQHSKPGR